MRLIGIYNTEDSREYAICYISIRADGASSVNGSESDLFLAEPGIAVQGVTERAFVLRATGFQELSSGVLLAFSESEILLRVEDMYSEGIWQLSVQRGGFVSVSQSMETWNPIRVGVLTVSDKASSGLREDMTGPALAESVKSIGAIVEEKVILPDDREKIEQQLLDWVDIKDIHLILVTGGTGISERDVTPEALMGIAHKMVPGIGEFMRSRTVYYTQRSTLSRGLAVTRSRSLIIAVPGSPRGAEQCLEAVAAVLRHGVEILRGWEKECGHSN